MSRRSTKISKFNSFLIGSIVMLMLFSFYRHNVQAQQVLGTNDKVLAQRSQTGPGGATAPPGCRYQEVTCIQAPCDPVLVCTSPTSSQATRTPIPPPQCALKSKGDANCDGRIDDADYAIWKCEYKGNGVCADPASNRTANFTSSSDAVVDMIDFEIWRKNRYSPLTPAPTHTALQGTPMCNTPGATDCGGVNPSATPVTTTIPTATPTNPPTLTQSAGATNAPVACKSPGATCSVTSECCAGSYCSIATITGNQLNTDPNLLGAKSSRSLAANATGTCVISVNDPADPR